MRTVRQLAWLVGMGMPFGAQVCLYGAVPNADGPAAQHGKTQIQMMTGAAEARHADEMLRRKAEAASDHARTLRSRQTSKDLHAAIRLFQQSARLFDAGHSPDKAAESLLQAGEASFILSQYDRALSSYARALSRAGMEPKLQCRILSGMARIYAVTGQASFAESYSQRALSACESLPSLQAQAEGLEARGETLMDAGDSVQGAEFFARARDRFAEAGDDEGRARALIGLAYSHFDRNWAESVRHAEQALNLWASGKDRYGVARARVALGFFGTTTGEWETAQCNYARARPVLHETGDKDQEAILLNGMGLVSQETGDLQASLEYYREARAAFAQAKDRLGELGAINAMGRVLAAQKQYGQLMPLYVAELRLARQTKVPAYEASALADLAGVHERAHRYALAESRYRRSLAIYQSVRKAGREGDIWIQLAHLAAIQEKYPSAISSLERAQSLKEQTDQVEDQARIQYELAYIYRRLGRLQDARAAIEKTIDIIESQRLKIANFDSRASYFASVHKYYALYIQLLMLLDRQDPTAGFAEKAFDAAEKSKVRSLLDLLTVSGQNASCDELLERQLQTANTVGVQAASTAGPKPPAATPALAWKEAQAEIEGDDLLLEYALGDEKSYVWALDKNGISGHELPPSEVITKLALGFRETLASPPVAPQESGEHYLARVREMDRAHQSYARRLGRMLLGTAPLERAKRVLVVADGALQYVPFAALSLPGAEGRDAFLISRHEVVVLPSASALDALRKNQRTPPTSVAAIFADPVFERNDPRVNVLSASSSRPRHDQRDPLRGVLRDVRGSEYLPRLTGSLDEARGILQTLNCKDLGRRPSEWVCPQGVLSRIGFDANRDYVLRKGLEGFRLVHIAAHGIIDARHPEMSGLILSLVNVRGEPQDGYLRLGDIYRLRLSADLVVLSSCDSALGKDVSSEGTIGLPRGFLYAGAKSVIASLWKVDDEATAKLMSGLYGRMRRGESPSSALRGAQLEMAQDGQWSKPFYWAAFVLQGDYK